MTGVNPDCDFTCADPGTTREIIPFTGLKSALPSYLCGALRNLVVDIGNSRIKTGVFEGKNLLKKATVFPLTAHELFHKATEFAVNNIIVSSVAAPDDSLLEEVRQQFRVVEFDHKMALPFVNTYQTPETLGKDRLAAVAGAIALFPGSACVIIDGGTCIKYELLTADGRYLGGNIAPGLRMRTRAMHHFTARLPEVETVLPGSPVGFSTVSALQNGAFRGLLLEVAGFVQTFEQHLGTTLKVVFTGGDASFLMEHLHFADQVWEPDLTLIGLNEIMGIN
jgi:type III pantothenate kinase